MNLKSIKNFFCNPTILFYILLVFGALHTAYNINNYNTYWADDGGAHLQYTKILYQENRLPSTEETYLAWHEPLYYIVLNGWQHLGSLFYPSIIDWLEFFNGIVHILFIFAVWWLTNLLTKNRWLSLINAFLFSVLFTSVKLGTYVNNELLAQFLIIILAGLFFHWKLDQGKRSRQVFIWSGILGIAILVKMTAVIILIAALMLWLGIMILKKNTAYISYIAIALVTVAILYLPWFIYKTNYLGSAFTINNYEYDNRQSILDSAGWKYIFTFNPSFVITNPYWYSQPYSFSAILSADIFGDYYNLFQNFDHIRQSPAEYTIQTGNGRFTSAARFNQLLWVNRIGVVLLLVWLIGLGGYVASEIKRRTFSPQKFFMMLLIFGGFTALLYNNISYPYLERGTLKASFILFIFPIISAVSFQWWNSVLKNYYLKLAVIVLPVILYAIFVFPIITIH